MKKVSILDPSILSYNLGNEIISNSIDNFISEHLNESFVIKLQYTERLRKKSKNHIKNSDLAILAGANSLSSNMFCLEQFPIQPFGIGYFKIIVQFLPTISVFFYFVFLSFIAWRSGD